MRTIKASEVRKGMRIEAEFPGGGDFVEVIRGTVQSTNPDFTNRHSVVVVRFTDHDQEWQMLLDHPVTVLAEPEPEWVEGAWYWVEFGGQGRRPMFRDNGLWSIFPGGTGMRYEDDEVTVLGRVLIVDWPGDDVAREFATVTNWWEVTSDSIKRLFTKVADAIRTQGGAP